MQSSYIEGRWIPFTRQKDGLTELREEKKTDLFEWEKHACFPKTSCLDVKKKCSAYFPFLPCFLTNQRKKKR